MVYVRRYVNDKTHSPLGGCPSVVVRTGGYGGRVHSAELPRFRDRVRNLWQAILCYFVLYRSRWTHEVPPVAAQQPVSVTGVVADSSHVTETSRVSEERVREEIVKEDIIEIPLGLILWWIPALIFYGLGDTLTTALVYGVGGREANPLARWLIAYSGGITLFALVKTVIIISLLFISYYWLGKIGWIIPAILTAVGVYLVVNNIMVFMSAI